MTLTITEIFFGIFQYHFLFSLILFLGSFSTSSPQGRYIMLHSNLGAWGLLALAGCLASLLGVGFWITHKNLQRLSAQVEEVKEDLARQIQEEVQERRQFYGQLQEDIQDIHGMTNGCFTLSEHYPAQITALAEEVRHLREYVQAALPPRPTVDEIIVDEPQLRRRRPRRGGRYPPLPLEPDNGA